MLPKLLRVDDVSAHVCDRLGVCELASLRASCVAGRESSSGWPVLTHLGRADTPLPDVWRSPTSDQVIAVVDGHGASMDRAIQWAVSAKDSAILLAISTVARDEDGSTCLHRLLGLEFLHDRRCIMHRRNHQLLWDALRLGANSGALDKMGHSPLHTAAHHGHADAARVLAAAGADVNLRDELGDTPLHVSAELGDPFTMRILLQAGADRESTADGDGLTALQIVRLSNMDCFRMLLNKDLGGTLQPPGWCTM